MNQVQLSPDWTSAGESPLRAVNTFACQLGAPAGTSAIPDGIVLYAGSATPPILLGSQGQIEEILEALNGRIPVDTVARMVMSRERAEELIGILSTTLEQYDAAVAHREVSRG